VRVVHARPEVALVDASHEADRVLISRPAHGGLVHHLGGTGRAVLRTAVCPVEVRGPGS
jgi:nucleotide-binding universal stress UspA family protein